MIYELRRYVTQVGLASEVEAALSQEGDEGAKAGTLLGSWHSEIGQLNAIFQMWQWPDANQREEPRPLSEDAGRRVLRLDADFLTAFPFVAAPTTGEHGPFYELRRYTYRAGAIGGIVESWEKALPARLQRSAIWFAGYVQAGAMNHFVHIWPYRSLDERQEVRSAAVSDGIWPPPGGGTVRYLAQENTILLPSSFSPAR